MNRKYFEGLVERNNKYAQKLSIMNEKRSIITQINFNMFNLYKDNRTVIKFEMTDKEKGIVDKTNITKYEVNFELIYKKYYNKDKLNELEKKLLMIVLNKREDLNKLSRGDKIMEKVNKKLDELSDDKYACMLYDWRERWKEEAKLEAEYEVSQEQYEKGLNEGIQYTAKNMLNSNMKIEDISKYTGLSIKEIELLK